jgi:hypothetical protein
MSPPTIKVRVGNAPTRKQSDRPAQPKHQKSLIHKIMEIVSNDIRRLIGKDDKSMENRMRYEEFMERFGK